MRIDEFFRRRLEEDPQFSHLDLRRGSAINDLLISPLSVLLRPLDDDLADIAARKSLKDYDDLSDEMMDVLAGNHLIVREAGNKATATVRLYFEAATSLDIAAGRQFTNADGSLVFVTTSRYRVSQSIMAQQRDDDGLFHTDDIPVEALEEGDAYIVEADAIVDMVRPIPGLARVTNPARSTGGSPRETNRDLYGRIVASVSTRQVLNSIGTFARLSERFPGVSDILLVGHGDPEMLRDESFDLGKGVGTNPLADFNGKVRFDPTNPSEAFVLRSTDPEPALADFVEEVCQEDYGHLAISGDAKVARVDAGKIFEDGFVRATTFVPAETKLTQDADGSDILYVESGALFAPGDICAIDDDNSPAIQRVVLSVTSSTIRLTETVPAQYEFGQNAVVKKIERAQSVGNAWLESERGNALGIEDDGHEAMVENSKLVFGKASYATDASLRGISDAQLETDLKTLFKSVLLSSGYNPGADAGVDAEVDALALNGPGASILEDLDAQFVTDFVTPSHFVSISGTEYPIQAVFEGRLRITGTLPSGSGMSYEVLQSVALSGDQDDGSTDVTGLILTDSDAAFVTDGIQAGDHVVLSDNVQHRILTVDSESQLTLVNGHEMAGSQSGLSYRITRPISLTGDQSDGRVGFGLVDAVKATNVISVSPVVQRPIPQSNGLKITGTFSTNDADAEGNYAYILVRKNGEGTASYYYGFGVAWRKVVEDPSVATATTADTSTDDTTVNVGSTAGFPDKGVGYLNGVRFTYTGTTATSFTGCSGVVATASPVPVTGATKNIFITDNGDLKADENAYLASGTTDIAVDTDYDFEILINPPSPNETGSSSSSVDVRIWESTESRPATATLSYGSYIPQSARSGPVTDTHFGLSVADTAGGQWYYDDIKIESIARQYAHQLHRFPTAAFDGKFKVHVRCRGEGDNAGVLAYGAVVRVWNETLSQWEQVGSHTQGSLQDVKSVSGLDVDTYKDVDGFVWVMASTSHPHGEQNGAVLHVDYAAILDDRTDGIHVGGKVDVLVNDREGLISDSADLIAVGRTEYLNAANGFTAPVASVDSVLVLDVDGNPAGDPLVAGEDFSLFVGNPELRFSALENNAILFDSGTQGQNVRVSYKRYPRIRELQAFLMSEGERVPAGDWLVRGFRPVFVDVTVEAFGFPDDEEEMAEILSRHIRTLTTQLDVSTDIIQVLTDAGATDVTTPITVSLEEHLLDGSTTTSTEQDQATIERDARFVPRDIFVDRAASGA